MKFRIVLLMLIFAVATACQKQEEAAPEAVAEEAGLHKVTAEEVIQASTYTYLQVDENGRDYWIATSKANVNEGDVLYYTSGMEMSNFHSKELDRTFESIYFVQQISSRPGNAGGGKMLDMPAQRNNTAAEDTGVSVEPLAGGISISELYANRDKYAGKTVKLRGKVVKFNAGIMDRNWVHIQDGSKDGDNYDVTVTTADNVSVGDVVAFEGTVVLKKDFGAGYSYEVLVEEARRIE